jgi:RNA polymerase sigma-70 factor (ECF subfamily)
MVRKPATGLPPDAANAPKPPGPQRIRFVDDTALVAGIRAGNPTALAEFHDRFALPVQRVLWGILGPDQDLSDLHQDVFVRALQSIDGLKQPEALPGWMKGIAVHTAQKCIEKRFSRQRFAADIPADDLAEASEVDPRAQADAREVLRAIHTVLDQLPVPERIAFALRHMDGLDLTEVAAVCEASLATVKRRLARAETEFAERARRCPLLAECIETGSSRWIRR